MGKIIDGEETRMIYVDAAILDPLKDLAKKHGRTARKEVGVALKDYLKRNEEVESVTATRS